MSQHHTVQVQYAVKYQTQNVTKAEYDLVGALFNRTVDSGSAKVTAIKFIRAQYGLGLKEAKDVCDAIGAQCRDNNPNY
jgi:ribosomal protein L7/L12